MNASILAPLSEARSVPAAHAISSRTLSLLELALVVALVELDLWILRAAGNGPARVAAYVAIGLVVAWGKHSCLPGFRHAEMPAPPIVWGRVLGVTLGLGLLLAWAGWWLREPHEGCWRFLERKTPLGLLSWAVLKGVVVAAQQLGLHGFLTPRCRELAGNRSAARLIAAALFALLHLPNLAVAGLCFLAGWMWIALYERTGRLLPLVLSHFLLAVLVHGLLPERIHLDLRVGSEAVNRLQRRLDENGLERLRALASPGYFASRGGTAEGFLRGLYRDVLRRAPEPWELSAWLERSRRLTRAEIAEAFLTSTGSAARSQGSAIRSQGSGVRTQRMVDRTPTGG